MREQKGRVEEAKLRLREAEAAAEQVKLKVDTIALQERKAVVGLGDGAFRERCASAHPPTILRDGATPPRLLRMNGPGACPIRPGLRSIRYPSRRRDTPAPPQDERILRFARDGAIALRDAPMGLLSANGV